MFIRFFTACLVVFSFMLPALAESSKTDAIQIEIPVAHGVEKYLDFLEYPSYMMVALGNNGVKLSNSFRTVLVDERTIQLQSAILRFTGKKGEKYFYKVSLEWDIPLKHLKFEVPVEVDTASILNGNIKVSVFIPLAGIFPDALIERIQTIVRNLSRLEIQNHMIGYFDGLVKNTDANDKLNQIFKKVMLQSYGSSVQVATVCPPHEPGDAEALSDQVYLLVTLAIWLILVPLGAVMFVFLRKRRLNSTL